MIDYGCYGDGFDHGGGFKICIQDVSHLTWWDVKVKMNVKVDVFKVYLYIFKMFPTSQLAGSVPVLPSRMFFKLQKPRIIAMYGKVR